MVSGSRGHIYAIHTTARNIAPTASAERSSESGANGSTNGSETSSLIPLFYTHLLSAHVGRCSQAPCPNCSRSILTTNGSIGPCDVRYTSEIRIPAITRWIRHLATISEMVVSYDRTCYPRHPARGGNRDRALRYRLFPGSRARYRFDAELVLCPNKILSPIRCLRPLRPHIKGP